MKASKHFTILSAALLVSTIAVMPGAAHAQAASPKAEKGYTISVFTKGFGNYSAPDSIVVADGHVFIGYGNNNAPDGSDGKSSNIIEYTRDGKVVHVYTVVGHNDGLKPVPHTPYLLAMQNEDANPNLVVIDTATKSQTLYNFAAPPPHGGGYDDIVIRKGQIYFSASNPASNPNDKPAIVEAKLGNGLITVSPVLEGNATATDVVTGQSVTLNLQDPDSMTLDPLGDLLMTSQADAELVLVRRPGTREQSVLQIPLTSPYGAAQADDTIFTPSDDGVILVADTPANIVYEIHKAEFAPGVAYTAAAAGTEGFISRLDLGFGLLTPVVTGLQSPHGMAFMKTRDDGLDDDDGYCDLSAFRQ
jgi:hypothetical protein